MSLKTRNLNINQINILVNDLPYKVKSSQKDDLIKDSVRVERVGKPTIIFPPNSSFSTIIRIFKKVMYNPIFTEKDIFESNEVYINLGDDFLLTPTPGPKFPKKDMINSNDYDSGWEIRTCAVIFWKDLITLAVSREYYTGFGYHLRPLNWNFVSYFEKDNDYFNRIMYKKKMDKFIFTNFACLPESTDKNRKDATEFINSAIEEMK